MCHKSVSRCSDLSCELQTKVQSLKLKCAEVKAVHIEGRQCSVLTKRASSTCWCVCMFMCVLAKQIPTATCVCRKAEKCDYFVEASAFVADAVTFHSLLNEKLMFSLSVSEDFFSTVIVIA